MHFGRFDYPITRTKTVYYVNLSAWKTMQVDKYVAKCGDIAAILL